MLVLSYWQQRVFLEISQSLEENIRIKFFFNKVPGLKIFFCWTSLVAAFTLMHFAFFCVMSHIPKTFSQLQRLTEQLLSFSNLVRSPIQSTFNSKVAGWVSWNLIKKWCTGFRPDTYIWQDYLKTSQSDRNIVQTIQASGQRREKCFIRSTTSWRRCFYRWRT